MGIYTVAGILHYVFLGYTILLFASILSSWVPKFAYHPVVRFSRQMTDPYLNIFRRFIPPLGGVLDLSPILGFFALEIIERIVMGILRGLI